MEKIIFYFKSSIGRKHLVAITGLMLCGFLISHLMGNLLLYKGPEAFNAYAHFLLSQSWIYLAEAGLFSAFAVHIFFAMKLTRENHVARGGVRYRKQARKGELTLASTTMPYTGLWVLVFLILHIWNFKFSDHSGELGIYGVVQEAFQNPYTVVYYIITFVLLGLHLKHGLQSVFQTLGFFHAGLNAPIRWFGNIFALTIFLGYSSIPIYFFFTKGGI